MLLADLRDLDQLRTLPESELTELAADIRRTLIQTVSATGGHLGPNLGVVELTIALHRTFDSPHDRIVFDTGHQAYVHKLLTGRASEFSTLRQSGGLSGYPRRAESVHDIVENSHASTALSWIDGIADGLALQGSTNHVIGVIGDGALTGGMAWEAMNNIAGKAERPLVIVVNDNGRSYSPTIGGFAKHLTTLRTAQSYESFLQWGKRTLLRIPGIGPLAFKALHGLKRGIGDVVLAGGLFQDLGMKYIGPIDGHDIAAVEQSLLQAKNFAGPVIVHCITKKGRGYAPAENDVADHFHGIGVIDPETGIAVKVVENTWTQAFGKALVEIGREREDVVAITAAMMAPTGLSAFAEEFPSRTFDVGIAEQHAATSAAGLAYAGMHPVVAIYATFINRAFDQLLMDCAMHKAGVTFVLDRAGVTGDDGASHNGIWDMALLSVVPNIHIYAPRDAETLEQALRSAVAHSSGPSVVRFPKGSLPTAINAVGRAGEVDVLTENDNADVVIVGVGALAKLAVEVGTALDVQGIHATVLNPLQVLPVPFDLLEGVRTARLVVTLEDGLVKGGIGDALSGALREANIFVPVKSFGVSEGFLDHANRTEVLRNQGLTVESVSSEIKLAFEQTFLPK